MSNKLSDIFDVNTCLTAEELFAYATGRMSEAEAHRAERHLLDCAFCAEALEGILQHGNVKQVPKIVDELNRQIDDASKRESSLRKTMFSFQRMAAVIALLLVAGGAWYYISNFNRNEKLFSQYYEPYNNAADTVAATEPAEAEAKQSAPATGEVKPQRELAAKSKSTLIVKNENSAGNIEIVSDKKTLETVSGDSVTAEFSLKSPEAPAHYDQIATMKDEDVGDEMKTKDLLKEEQVIETSSRQKTLSKTAAPAAATERRETEYADVRLDASELQRAPLNEAIRFYQSKQYVQAYEGTETFLKRFPKDAEALFYNGVSALSLNKDKVAVKRLKACLDTGSEIWKEEASWYLSLSYIKLGKDADAKPLLQFLANGTGIHAAEAKQMLESIH